MGALTDIYRAVVAPLVRPLIKMSSSFEPRIIAAMDGGLGSQMWQYALGRGASLLSNMPVEYDLTFFDDDGKDINGVLNRNFDIERVFGLSVQRAEKSNIDFYKLNFYRSNRKHERFVYDESVQRHSDPVYIGGYHINARYIDWQGDELRELYSFKLDMVGANAELHRQILSTESAVALHIRQGDYVGSVHDVTTPKYFRDAVSEMARTLDGREPTFFVFSNGMEKAREMTSDLPYRFIYAECNDNDSGAYDMYLMSECEHFIISNSSFGWWPAWLSRRAADKHVIMPSPWIQYEPPSARGSMCPDGWRLLDVE